MPLYERKPFPLAEKPMCLKPNELVFQIRFTKEIFRDYREYLKRLNLYRKRVWKCKVTGRINLTYEEALLSEKKGAEKVQNFPKELVAPVLRDVQFSMASLKDLVNGIVAKLQGPLSEGCELFGRKNGHLYPCKIVNVLEDDGGKLYEVAWLDKEKKVTGNANLKGEELIRNKLPFSREVLKSFIRESTYRNVPWILHEWLAKQHGISTDPPKELKNQVSLRNGLIVCNKKRKKPEDGKNETDGNLAKGNSGASTSGDTENQERDVEEIKYPIDDLLVPPSDDDGSLTERPSPCRDFNIPIDCVGDFLMVWDFCTSFGKLLHLYPFSLEDFENALCHKDSNLVLIAESHSALLRLLIKDNGEYSMALRKKKRKNKISLVTWSEYLCDFLEMCGTDELLTHSSIIKRGHYGLLDIHVKLRIFDQLIVHTLDTDVFREKMDESIDERHALAAARRDEALEEGRKRREEKRLKTDPDNKEITEGYGGELDGNDSASHPNQNNGKLNGDVSSKLNGKEAVNRKKHLLEHSENEEADNSEKKNSKKQMMEGDSPTENVNNRKRAVHKMMKNEIKEMIENKSAEQRKEYLEREIEKRYIRTSPLGKDREHNKYWFFKRDGRIFVESSDLKLWGYYSTNDEVDGLLGSLNPKGVRERDLKKQIEKFYNKICSEVQKRTQDADQSSIAMEDAVVRRSTRIRAPPRDNPAVAFLKYSNRWKEE